MPDQLVKDPYAMWRLALAEADRIFASPPGLDRPVEGCTFCASESDLIALGGDPWAVPDDVLTHFMGEVVDHWDADQYPILWRRLMPRALRHWGPEGSCTEPSRELSRLGQYGAGLLDWPAAERAAVEQAFQALLNVAVSDGRSPSDIRDLVEGIANATDGLEPWLEYIAELPGPAGDASLVRLAVAWGTDLLWEDFEFWWWHEGDPRSVADWLVTQRPRIASFAARNPRCKNAADALIAISHLQEGSWSPWFYPYGQRSLLRLADVR
ncbi:hypothetical protein [Actinacidiphila glaucinigra]|uniref:hypothetical protein n=1 Tax=Actinacidiphila glaucinigra TaxID=235986 RepID=UPI0038285FA3